MEKWEEAKAALLSDISAVDNAEAMGEIAKALNLGIMVQKLIGSLNETKNRMEAMGLPASNEHFMAGTDIQIDDQFIMVRINLTTKEEAEEREAMAMESGLKLSDLPKPTVN